MTTVRTASSFCILNIKLTPLTSLSCNMDRLSLPEAAAATAAAAVQYCSPTARAAAQAIDNFCCCFSRLGGRRGAWRLSLLRRSPLRKTGFCTTGASVFRPQRALESRVRDFPPLRLHF